MKIMSSLQARLAVAVGVSVTVLWLVAAAVTAHRMNREMEEVFDDGLKSTAVRILSIARHDIRESRPHLEADGRIDERSPSEEYEARQERDVRYGERVAFVVRDSDGRILLSSSSADASLFPDFAKTGFFLNDTHRFYYDTDPGGEVSIAVAEPLDQRRKVSQKMLMSLLAPLLVVIPFSLLAILVAVRRSLRPVRALHQVLSNRGVQDLSPVPDSGLPSELMLIPAGINQLLDRLKAAFNAERAFAANAAHELRTPVAGAIAQSQRIRAETREALTGQRATEIEMTLKRLMSVSEKLMQLARAEGGRLRTNEEFDIRDIAQMMVKDFERAGESRIVTSLPDRPVFSTLDPDVIGILLRNLIENALKHGLPGGAVTVVLETDGQLRVDNDGEVLPPATLKRLMQRFERGAAKFGGNGLGLAIVKAIAERTGATIDIVSPRPRKSDGVEVKVQLPI